MKTSITQRIFTGIIFISSFGYALHPVNRVNNELRTGLEVIGIAIGEDSEPIAGVEVKLFKENEAMEWVDITSVAYHDHNFTFTLEPDAYYTIEVSKKGFVTRSIGISTMIPENYIGAGTFKYGFEVILFEEKDWMNEFYLDFPVALVSFNPTTGNFENNTKYTRHIKAKIKESERPTRAENYNNVVSGK